MSVTLATYLGKVQGANRRLRHWLKRRMDGNHSTPYISLPIMCMYRVIQLQGVVTNTVSLQAIYTFNKENISNFTDLSQAINFLATEETDALHSLPLTYYHARHGSKAIHL